MKTLIISAITLFLSVSFAGGGGGGGGVRPDTSFIGGSGGGGVLNSTSPVYNNPNLPTRPCPTTRTIGTIECVKFQKTEFGSIEFSYLAVSEDEKHIEKVKINQADLKANHFDVYKALINSKSKNRWELVP